MIGPLLTATEAAAYLGLPVRTLAFWREKRRGPRYYRLEGRIRYAPGDLDAWLQTKRS